MRTRALVLAAIVCGLMTALVAPMAANAAPRHNHGLTEAATPNPIVEGEGVLIYGRLTGADSANQTIYLYHRLADQVGFSLVSKTTTNQYGFYEFVRADGVVLTNRNWYVVGPGDTHSHTIHEKVASSLTLTTAATSATTAQVETFTGTVAPNHPHQVVELQDQSSITGSGWKTIAKGVTNADSAFTITHRFRIPGDYTLRALLKSDRRNIAGSSDSVTLAVQQEQNPLFTINSSDPLLTDGQSVTISGDLYATGTTPDPAVPVTLYGRTATGPLHALASSTTGTDGSYSFSQTPTTNTVYVVEETAAPKTRTAPLFQGIQDVVTLTPSSTTIAEGQADTFSGNVTPDKTGHWIYLQRQGTNGGWQDVAATQLTAGSHYTFSYAFGQTGTFTLRTRIYGGPADIGGASTPVTITVSGVAPASGLPTAG